MIKVEVNNGNSELEMKGPIIDLLADTAIILKHISIKISEILEKEGYKMEPGTIIDAIIETMKETEREIEIEKAEAEKNKLKKNKIININQLKQIKEQDNLDTLINTIFFKK